MIDNSFSGEHDVVLDEAGRVAIPRALRSKLGNAQVVLTKGPDPCLWLYATEDWERRLKKIIDAADPDTAEGRDIRRRYIAPAQPLDIDKQGRVLIPPLLREFAGLSRECMVVGQYDYIEIWDKARYKNDECTQEKYYERSESFARKKEERELKGVGNSAHSGIAGGDNPVSRSKGQE